MRSWNIGRLILPLAAAAVLASCASGDPPPSQPQPPPVAANDQCGAHEMSYLVGKAKTEIPPTADPSLRRVACTTCAVTMDFNPRRLNIFFDSETGVIKEVKCG